MNEPIELIEKDLKYKRETLEGLEKRIRSENDQVESTAAEIRVLENEVATFEEAIALLGGKDKKNGKCKN